jgi:hypothetical protein
MADTVKVFWVYILVLLAGLLVVSLFPGINPPDPQVHHDLLRRGRPLPTDPGASSALGAPSPTA